MLSPQQLFDRLAALGIAHRTVEHAPVFTVEQAKEHRGVLPGHHIKNLFLRNKKKQMWLVVAIEDRRIDLKRLGERLGAGRLSFGSPERLRTYLGVNVVATGTTFTMPASRAPTTRRMVPPFPAASMPSNTQTTLWPRNAGCRVASARRSPRAAPAQRANAAGRHGRARPSTAATKPRRSRSAL